MKRAFLKDGGGLQDSQGGSMMLEQLFAAIGAVLIAAAVVPAAYFGLSRYLLSLGDSVPIGAAESVINVKDER